MDLANLALQVCDYMKAAITEATWQVFFLNAPFKEPCSAMVRQK